MNCLITAGPTFEPLDAARRLTNFSTGRLGSELAEFLASRGHRVDLLLGQQSTFRGHGTLQPHLFSTTSNLRDLLAGFSGRSIDAVFHAAAVSDFSFGKVWSRSPDGNLHEITSGKFSTRGGSLLAELVPTPKLILELRKWFPKALLVGWKYEVDGDRPSVIELARRQIQDCQTNVCVANGPAYGSGFGLVSASPNASPAHFPLHTDLFPALEEHMLKQQPRS